MLMLTHLDEGDAHGNDGNAKDTVAHCGNNLQLASKSGLFVGKQTSRRHQVSETNLVARNLNFHLKPSVDRGEGDEAKVGGGDEVPVLPKVEHDRAQHDVRHDDHNAQGKWDDHLVQQGIYTRNMKTANNQSCYSIMTQLLMTRIVTRPRLQ